MSAALVIRPADEKDRLATLENTWRYWGEGKTRDEFVENRLNSPQFQRSQRFVGLVNDHIVVSLAAYTCQFRSSGDVLDGIAIGSVYTREEHRGHGYASQLLAHVDQHYADAGAKLSVLYSDIEPAFYERHNYIACPSWLGQAEINPDTSSIAKDWQLKAFDPTDSLSTLERLYTDDHSPRALSIVRPGSYWEFTLRYRKDDQFYWFLDSDAQCRGYVRLAVGRDQELRIVDHALSPRSDAMERALYSSVKRLAAERGIGSVQAWVPNTPAARACFQVLPRDEEVTMIKALDKQFLPTPAAIESGEFFHEVDHV